MLCVIILYLQESDLKLNKINTKNKEILQQKLIRSIKRMQGINMHRIDSANIDNINLLDIIPNAKQSQKNIYTFHDFKQWFNSIDLNQAVVEPLKSKIKRPQKQSHIKIKSKNTLGSNDSYGQQLLISAPILQLGLKKRKQSFQSNNPFEIQQPQNSIRQSSARSSRSFYGYEQINQYELKQKLGKGAFSQVYEGIDVQSSEKKKYAIKIMQSKRLKMKLFRKATNQQKQSSNPNTGFAFNDFPLQSSFRDGQQSSQFVNNEIALLKKIDHQYITKLYQVIIDKQKGKAYLVLQYCENGFICENKSKSTKNAHSYRKLLESECKRYFKQLALAINYIHTAVKIAHRDIKPQNILISKNDQIKLSDFGLGTQQMETDQFSGTKLFMPPQNAVVGGKKIVKTQSADIWAMGVTLLIMLSGTTPEYKDNSIVDLHSKIQQIKDASPELKNFLNRCLEVNPQKRITSEEMLSHQWLCGDDPLAFLIQRSLVKQFEIVVTKQQENQAIKDVSVRKPKKKNLVISLAV